MIRDWVDTALDGDYRLFLDDLRHPKTDGWVICRSSDDAIRWLRNAGIPKEIAFDHDLGGGDTAMQYIKELENILISGERFPEGFSYTVHSQNPVGAENIRSYMDSLLRDFGGSK